MLYRLSETHDESIIDRMRTIEEFHPAWVAYKATVRDAWLVYQTTLETARAVREIELPHEEQIAMAQGKKKMSFMKDIEVERLARMERINDGS